MNITFNELRKIKDSLPDGSMKKIAEQLNVSADTVRNYFGGDHYESGESMGVHFEPGPGGGIVQLEDTTILDMARSMLESEAEEVVEEGS